MKQTISVLVIASVLAAAGTVSAQTPGKPPGKPPGQQAPPGEATVAGFWEAYSDGKPGGWFLFFERDGVYEGALVKGFDKPGERQQVACTRCTDERRNAPIIGMSIVKGMQRKGLVYENGTILDPRNGSVYKAKMALSPDSQRLEVRGFLGIEIFGQSQIWQRLPDNVLPPDELPENVRQYVAVAEPPPPVRPQARPPNRGNAAPGQGPQQQRRQ